MNGLTKLSLDYLLYNYDYCYLAGRLAMGDRLEHGATLVTGSSHSLVGFDDKIYPNSLNCSMNSQDLYYDYKCAEQVINSNPVGTFHTCFIIFGYYIAYQDLSLSKITRQSMISSIYYPLLGDAHNWQEPIESDRWSFLTEELSADARSQCEMIAIQTSQDMPYYSAIKKRVPFFKFATPDTTWGGLSQKERDQYALYRAGTGERGHGRLLSHRESWTENKTIYCEFVQYLTERGVRPVVILPPFSKEYNNFTPEEMKEGAIALINSTDCDVDFVNFNDSDLFDKDDFIDTDHLNEKGSYRFMDILYSMFG